MSESVELIVSHASSLVSPWNRNLPQHTPTDQPPFSRCFHIHFLPKTQRHSRTRRLFIWALCFLLQTLLSRQIHGFRPPQYGRQARSDDVILILLPNSVSFPIIFLAALSIGAIVTPINPLSSLSEIKMQALDSNASLAFAPLPKVDDELIASLGRCNYF